jgi:hypothetical protein
VRPLTVLFTYYAGDPDWNRLQAIHLALLAHHNPGIPIVPLVAGSTPFLAGTIDVGAIPSPQYNCDRLPARWFHHRTPDTEAERYLVVESDTLVTAPLWQAFAPAWAADVAGAVIATPATHPGWEWWADVPDVPTWARAGVMPSGFVLYSAAMLDALARSTLDAFAEVRIGTAAMMAGLTLAAVPGLVETVHCTPKLIRLSDKPGIYHPVKQYGGPGGECLSVHDFGRFLLTEPTQ